MSRICGIYKITSPVNKIYIGQSVDCLRRKYTYSIGHAFNQTRLHNSILNYGWKNHAFEIIHPCKREELNDLEKYYIALYQCHGTEHGLNSKKGGAGNIYKRENALVKKMKDIEETKSYCSITPLIKRVELLKLNLSEFHLQLIVSKCHKTNTTPINLIKTAIMDYFMKLPEAELNDHLSNYETLKRTK